MAYDPKRLERFALQAEAMIQKNQIFGGSVQVHAVGEALGLPPAESRNIASYLQKLGWAEVDFTNEPELTLTPKGFAEIAKLRRPAWQQWIDQHPLTMSAILTVLTGIVAGIVYTAITYFWFIKPR
jgi:hypothetical protein